MNDLPASPNSTGRTRCIPSPSSRISPPARSATRRSSRPPRASASPTRTARAYRRLCRPLLRQHRLWPHRGRRGDSQAGAPARLLPHLCGPHDGRTRDPVRPAGQDGAGQDEQGVLRHVGFGRQRDPGQARLVLQQPAGPAEEEEDHLAPARLSRLLGGGRLDDRHELLPRPHGPAAAPASSTPACRTITGAPRRARPRRNSPSAGPTNSRR